MACCGRPDNRNKKSQQKSYYERYAYLSSHQKQKQLEVDGSKCNSCDALTMCNVDGSCIVCGNPKSQGQEKSN
jgi:hypothetical protein